MTETAEAWVVLGSPELGVVWGPMTEAEAFEMADDHPALFPFSLASAASQPLICKHYPIPYTPKKDESCR